MGHTDQSPKSLTIRFLKIQARRCPPFPKRNPNRIHHLFTDSRPFINGSTVRARIHVSKLDAHRKSSFREDKKAILTNCVDRVSVMSSVTLGVRIPVK